MEEKEEREEEESFRKKIRKWGFSSFYQSCKLLGSSQ